MTTPIPQAAPSPGDRGRAAAAFVLLFVLYQSAEGVGQRLLHSFSVQAALMVACVLAAWPLSRWLGWRGYGAYALDRRGRWLGWLLGGLLAACLAKGLVLVVGLRMGIYVHAADAPAAWPSIAAALPMLLVATVVPSLAEDILARGFWYRAAGIRWRHGAAFVAFSAAYFVLNHLYRLQRGPLEWLMLFCFGTAYALALWRSGLLWAALGLHWGWNLANELWALALPLDSADAAGASLLSAAVHLLIAAALCLPGRRPAPPA